MQWSKLKQRIEENLASSVRSRVAIHSTAYGGCTCGHAWLTLDGGVIANFCTRAYYNRFEFGNRFKDRGTTPEQLKRYNEQFVDYGELSRQDVYRSCWDYIHTLNFEKILESDHLLIQSLAVLDKRLGKRRYSQVTERILHPLARKLFETRLACELAN